MFKKSKVSISVIVNMGEPEIPRNKYVYARGRGRDEDVKRLDDAFPLSRCGMRLIETHFSQAPPFTECLHGLTFYFVGICAKGQLR